MIIQAIHKEVKISKAGKPYASVSIQLDEYKDGTGKRFWIGGFGNKDTWFWKKGDEVMPDVKQNGQYYNFSYNDSKENNINVYKLPVTVGFVMELLKGKQQSVPVQKAPETVEYPDEDIQPEDIPF